MKNKIITRSEEETKKLGGRLWEENKKYLGKKTVVFALVGELGAGKTQLVKGLAKAMGIRDDVFSPTFTIEAEYDLGKLVHIDTWRMEDPEELLEIGFEERIKEKQVMVIEWADRVRKLLQNQISDRVGGLVLIWIDLKYGRGKNERIIKITSYLPGSTSEQSQSELKTVSDEKPLMNNE